MLLTGLLFSGCDLPDTPVENKEHSGEVAFNVIRVGKCQYLSRWIYNQNAVLAHKGDCDNPIHVYNKIETTTKIIPPTLDKLSRK